MTRAFDSSAWLRHATLVFLLEVSLLAGCMWCWEGDLRCGHQEVKERLKWDRQPRKTSVVRVTGAPTQKDCGKTIEIAGTVAATTLASLERHLNVDLVPRSNQKAIRCLLIESEFTKGQALKPGDVITVVGSLKDPWGNFWSLWGCEVLAPKGGAGD
jgi:hypothetical protein